MFDVKIYFSIKQNLFSINIHELSKLCFLESFTIYTSSFDSVHGGVWGPSPVVSRMGYKYFILFARYTWIYVMCAKPDVWSYIVKSFMNMIETQFSIQTFIKLFRSDSGETESTIAILVYILFRSDSMLPELIATKKPSLNASTEKRMTRMAIKQAANNDNKPVIASAEPQLPLIAVSNPCYKPVSLFIFSF